MNTLEKDLDALTHGVKRILKKRSAFLEKKYHFLKEEATQIKKWKHVVFGSNDKKLKKFSIQMTHYYNEEVQLILLVESELLLAKKTLADFHVNNRLIEYINYWLSHYEKVKERLENEKHVLVHKKIHQLDQIYELFKDDVSIEIELLENFEITQKQDEQLFSQVMQKIDSVQLKSQEWNKFKKYIRIGTYSAATLALLWAALRNEGVSEHDTLYQDLIPLVVVGVVSGVLKFGFSAKANNEVHNQIERLKQLSADI